MKISTKARYGMRAMAELASPRPSIILTVKEMGKNQNISTKYLSQIMNTLKTSGLVRSVSGLHGGFVLSKPAKSITLMEIFNALEGSTSPVECVDCQGECPMEQICPTRDTWVEIKRSVDKILRKTTLKDLVERKSQKSKKQN